MNTKTKKPSKAKIESAMRELAEIKLQKKMHTDRENVLRHAIADSLHEGEDGTENFDMHGYQIKVVRKMSLSITKGELCRLEEEDAELHAEVTKTETKLSEGAAKKKLDELGDYVTMKQGLPTVTIVPIK
tara:strand:+ start:8432 stop:8821 length:390 start_codon:yes stop_codon:yes gene_type:complete